MKSKKIIIDEKVGPITRKSAKDKVILLGTTPEENSLFEDNIELVLYPEGSNQAIRVDIPESGYHMQLFLGDFTGDGLSEIMVRGDFGGSGSFTIANIFTYEDEKLNQIFNQTRWSEQYPCSATYLDNYQLQVTCSNSSKPMIIDLSSYPESYLDFIYTSDKKLKPFISASVSYLNEVLPIKPVYQDYYDLLLNQRIVGIANADTLGYVQTRLNYKDNQFIPFMRGVLTGNLLPDVSDTNRAATHTFYSFITQALASCSLPPSVTSSFTTRIQTLQDAEYSKEYVPTPSYFCRTKDLSQSLQSPTQLYHHLTRSIIQEYKHYEYLLHTAPYLTSYQLQKCSLLLNLTSHLRSLNHPYRTEIYYNNQFNIREDNLDLIINSITEDANTLYIDAYLVNLTDNFLSQITNFNITLRDATGKIFAKKTFDTLDIGNQLNPYQGKRIFLSFFDNQYSLAGTDTSSLSWNYTYSI